MLRIGSKERSSSHRIVPARGRVWHLVVMLVMTMSLMAVAWFLAERASNKESAVQDKSGTSTVSASMKPDEPVESPESNESVHAVELSRLSDFQDHTRSFEPEPYYYLLDLARRNPARWMDEHARRDVTWSHLLRDPDKYRGQLIFLKGRLRRLIEDDAGENEFGIAKRYEGWLYTDEGGQFPYAVIASEPPTGMPLGSIYEWVSVSGYFLGWYRYTTQEGKPHAAPILLACRFHWHKQPPSRPDLGLGFAGGLLIASAVGAAFLVFIFLALRKSPSRHATASTDSGDSFIFEELPAEPSKSSVEDRH